MSERAFSPVTYVVVDLILVFLTILTVALSFVHESGLWHIAGGLVIAIFKASLVVLFFMHALRSPRSNARRDCRRAFLAGGRDARSDIQRLRDPRTDPQPVGTLT